MTQTSVPSFRPSTIHSRLDLHIQRSSHIHSPPHDLRYLTKEVAFSTGSSIASAVPMLAILRLSSEASSTVTGTPPTATEGWLGSLIFIFEDLAVACHYFNQDAGFIPE